MRSSLPGMMVALARLAPATNAADSEPGEGAPPKGSPADVALWNRGLRASEAVVVERSQAGRLQQRVKSNRLTERLEGAAARATPEAAKPLRALRERLLTSWTANYEIMTRQWPVDPTRVCWYQVMLFEGALASPSRSAQGDLGQARQDLTGCADRAELAVRALAESNRALAAAADEAVRALAAPGEEATPEAGPGAEVR
jgi:hypothetical protein